MALKRIIPCLLLRDDGLVKTVKFNKSTYIGDPINAVKIFNEKEVDELVFLDIDASRKKKEPPYQVIRDIATECFMPFCYGGGIKTIDQIRKIIASGAEKIAINTTAYYKPELIREAAEIFGSSTIVVSIDYKKNLFGKENVFVEGGKKNTKKDPVSYAVAMEELGAGELFINSIERDGMMTGYDLEMVERITESVSIPVIACGGASKLDDFKSVLTTAGASAAAAGSFFVFQGKKKGVLISYPNSIEVKEIIS